MLNIYAHRFVRLTHDLEQVLSMLATIIAGNSQLKKQGKYPLVRAEDNYDMSEVYKILDGSLAEIKNLCEELNLRSALEHIKRFEAEKPYRDDRFQSLANLIREARQRVEDDLKNVQFLFVPASKVEYYDEPIFGEAVEKRFYRAIDDIRAAGNCFALGQWTGVVYHCMAVIQEGLTRLAKHLGITID